MSNPRYLTKSRFKLAMECPTKLFYTGKKDYANQKLSDPFLAALADGGFQVGRLAQCYFHGGTEIETRDYDEAVRQTEELLKQEHAIIYEAAFRYSNFFIRAMSSTVSADSFILPALIRSSLRPNLHRSRTVCSSKSASCH